MPASEISHLFLCEANDLVLLRDADLFPKPVDAAVLVITCPEERPQGSLQSLADPGIGGAVLIRNSNYLDAIAFDLTPLEVVTAAVVDRMVGDDLHEFSLGNIGCLEQSQ